MKKSLLFASSALVAAVTFGCQPAAETPDVSTDTGVVAPMATDSNVTATAETPEITETP